MKLEETQKNDLLTQGKNLTELPEGYLADDQEIVSLDKKVKLRKHREGYAVWTVTKGKDDVEEGVWEQISNFTMECINVERFVDHRDQPVQRKVCLTDCDGRTREACIEPGDMNTLANFVRWLESKGNYTFEGTPPQLTAIKRSTFPPGMPETQVKNIAGHDPKTHTWLFGNGGICGGHIHKAGDDGLVQIPTTKAGSLSLPARVYRLVEPDMDSTVARLPMLQLESKYEARQLLQDTIRDMSVLWGPQAEVVVGWFLAILFRSRCLADPSLGNFPLLFVASPPKQGKSAMMKMLLNMYGLKGYTPKGISSFTETSIYTLPNVVCDIPVWLDEYREDAIRKKVFLREALKNNYDGSARTVGTLSEFVTKSRVARTGFVVTGEMRPSDSALDSRCVTVELQHHGDPALLNQVESRATHLSAVLVHVLKEYEAYWDLFHDRLERVCSIFSEDPLAQIRAIENYAKPCAALDIIIPDETRATRFKAYLGVKVEQNKETSVMSDMITELPYLIERNKAPIQYKIDWEKECMNVQASFLMSEYFREHRDVNRYKTDELVRLGKDAGLLCSVMHKENTTVRAYVTGYNRETGEKKDSQQRCFIFDLRATAVRDAAQRLEPRK